MPGQRLRTSTATPLDAAQCYKNRMARRLAAPTIIACLALMSPGVRRVQDHQGDLPPPSPHPRRRHRRFPPLPRLDIDAYPPEAREQIGAAYRAVTAAPADANAVGRLGLVLHAWEEFEAAAQAYGRAQAQAPTDADWWYFGAMLATRRGLHDESARQLRQARTRRPDDALIALRLADAALDAGHPDDAAPLYDALATRPETAPAAFYGLGRVRQLTGDHTGARTAYEQAVALYPEFGAAHYALAQLQRRAGDTAAARASLQRQQQCLACWPMPPDPWRTRLADVRQDAAALLQQGVATAGRASETAAADAIRLHEAAIAQAPHLGQAHINLIELYARTGNLARAEAHYASARALPGYTAEAHRTWGWVLLRQRRPADALPVFSEAVQLAPDSAQAQYGLAMTFELEGRAAEAAPAYARAVGGLTNGA